MYVNRFAVHQRCYTLLYLRAITKSLYKIMINRFSTNTKVLFGLDEVIKDIFADPQTLYELTVIPKTNSLVEDSKIVVLISAPSPEHAKSWCETVFGREPESIFSIEDILDVTEQRDGCTAI